MNNIEKSLSLLTESPQAQVPVKILSTKMANGKDVYAKFPWIRKEFPNPKNITGLIHKDQIDKDLEEIEVQFARFKNGRVEKFSFVAPFKAEDIKEI